MEERKVYESPQVELIEVNVEQGFATSNGTDFVPEDLPW